MRNIPLSVLLSVNGGYVDTAGFLALQGLFTAHVTGNFVTLGATVAMGAAGALPKLLALPLFCIVVLASRIIGIWLQKSGRPVLRPLLAGKLVLLICAAAFAAFHGRFTDADGPSTLFMGMMLVAAMAIQNGVHRVHLSKSPPSTLMTGTTTQVMLDLAEVLTSNGEGATAASKRIKRMALSVLAFALGCAAAAIAFIVSPALCFVAPAVLGALAFVAKVEPPEGD